MVVQSRAIYGQWLFTVRRSIPGPIPPYFQKTLVGGTDDPEEKRELASLGAWQIFKKPFSPKTFSAHVLNLFRER